MYYMVNIGNSKLSILGKLIRLMHVFNPPILVMCMFFLHHVIFFAELKRALALIDAYQVSLLEGKAAFEFEGKVVDPPGTKHFLLGFS